jgi:hypothetical protein
MAEHVFSHENDSPTQLPWHPDFLSRLDVQRTWKWLAHLHACFWGDHGPIMVGSTRNPSRLSRTEDSSVNLQTRESKPKCVLESALLDDAHEQISSQRPCLNVPR